MIHRYDDVVLTETVTLKISTGEIASAPAGCQATVLFFSESRNAEISADLEIYLSDGRFGFADVAVSKMKFYKSALEKQGGS
jgi:hypothetical protein